MKYNCHHFHLISKLEVDKMLLLQASIMIMVFVALHGSYDPQTEYYSAGASMYEDRFGCKVCNIGKKHSINVCTHCKIGWEKEPFACHKCQFGSEAGKYNCQHCRRNEDIAFEDTSKCRKDESVEIERSQGGTKEFLSKDSKYEYYKVTVDKGTRIELETKVLEEGEGPFNQERALVRAFSVIVKLPLPVIFGNLRFKL